jgi:branched-chain amino acid transport system permease protein
MNAPGSSLAVAQRRRGMPRGWDLLVVLAVLVLLPIRFTDHVFVPPPIYNRITDLFIFAILALGLNVVVGYTGLLHLGIGAFFGIGAYLTGIATVQAYPFQMGLAGSVIVATVGAALCGLILGAPTLRLRGDYLALVTLGFGEVVNVSLRNLEEITAGTRALGPIPPPGVKFVVEYWPYYYLALGFLTIVVLLLMSFEQSRLGRALVALREDELAASCTGINVPRVKLAAFALSAGIAGLAGCLYATKLTNTANPDTYGFNMSITVLCCIILGGLGSIRGALLGVLLLKGYEFLLGPALDQWSQGFKANVVESLKLHFPDNDSLVEKAQTLLTFSNWKLMIFGLALIIVVRFRPEGLLPSKRVQHELHEVEHTSPKR